MRGTCTLLAAGIVALGGGPVAGQATSAYMTLEVNGSSIVSWDDIQGGFVLDILVGNDDPAGMMAFGIVLDGDPGFGYAAVTPANYDAAQDWDQYVGWRPPAGSLPMHHAPNEYVATICQFPIPPFAQNGRAAWIEFTSVPPRGTYVIGTDDAYVGDSLGDGVYFGDAGFTLTPLTILPEPGALGLLTLGGLALRRRRRRPTAK